MFSSTLSVYFVFPKVDKRCCINELIFFASYKMYKRKMPPVKIPEEQLTELRACVTLVRAQHSILHQPGMVFFKEIIILCQSILFFDLKSKSKSNRCKLFINQNQIKNHILQIDLKSFLNQIKNQNCTVAI